MNNFLDILNQNRPDPFRFNPIFNNPMMRSLAVDVDETDNSYIISADVPGYSADEISLSIDGNVLRIVAEKSSQTSDTPQLTEENEKPSTATGTEKAVKTESHNDGITEDLKINEAKTDNDSSLENTLPADAKRIVKKVEEGLDELRSIVRERRSYSRVERRIVLGSRKIDEANIKASLDKGVLTIGIPFAEEPVSKKIAIETKNS